MHRTEHCIDWRKTAAEIDADYTRMAEENDRLRNEAIDALSAGGVLVRLCRPEGYEDVHPELVAEDAIRDNWPEYETLTANE